MKQIIALVATAAVSASMFAQGIDKRDIIIEPNPNEQEQCCMDAPKPACPFEGIKLSDKQKDALKALDESRKADFEKKMADKRAERDAKKAQKIAEKNNKKEEMMKQREAAKAQREADRKEYLKKVKSILSADQYLQFLENSYVNAKEPQPQGMRHDGPRGKGPKPFRKPGERRLRPVETNPIRVE